jgi:predicted Rossmann-fold nucleotide-binding protein
LDELFEVLTLRQIGLHRKPVGILDHEGYFASLLAAIDTMADQGFVAREHIDHLIVMEAIEPLFDALAAASAS